ncbi:hypothetical protein ABTH97_19950, partial [Acinetobacter baumannii]
FDGQPDHVSEPRCASAHARLELGRGEFRRKSQESRNRAGRSNKPLQVYAAIYPDCGWNNSGFARRHFGHLLQSIDYWTTGDFDRKHR